jgi:hypothetical protein
MLSVLAGMETVRNVQAQSTTKLHIQVRANPQWWNNWMKDTNHSCAWGSLKNANITMNLEGKGGKFTRTQTTDSSGNIVMDVWHNQTVTLKSATANHNGVKIKMKQTNPKVKIGTGSAYYLDIDMVSSRVPETVKISGKLSYFYPAPIITKDMSNQEITITGACQKPLKIRAGKQGKFSVDIWPYQTITIMIPGGTAGPTYRQYDQCTRTYNIENKNLNIGDINMANKGCK